MTATFATTMCVTAFAGNWEQAGTDWKYADNGTYMTGWQWIDGKSYYFDGNGIMAKSTVIDGYELNADGQWTVNGVVQTQGNQTENTGVNHSANYDPAHPLAGKIDEWNLRLPYQYIGSFTINSNNVQAMLTGQLDQYFMPTEGYSTDSLGNSIYTSKEAIENNKFVEQAIYDWFCNWLNNMDFENMSEMDRAIAIKNVLAECSYDSTNSMNNNSDYSILVEKKGMCGDFAMTACSLAKSLGLKSAISGTGMHTVYYIQIDGKAYMGSNQVLELNYPSPDYVYFQ